MELTVERAETILNNLQAQIAELERMRQRCGKLKEFIALGKELEAELEPKASSETGAAPSAESPARQVAPAPSQPGGEVPLKVASEPAARVTPAPPTRPELAVAPPQGGKVETPGPAVAPAQPASSERNEVPIPDARYSE